MEVSRYGMLKDVNGNLYVRLEEVHAKVMERDRLTSLQAATRIFGPFVADASSALGLEHGAYKLRLYLGVADSSDHVNGLDAYALKTVGRVVPYVSHSNFDKGTPEALLYALAAIAAEVWAPYSDDVNLVDRLNGLYAIEGSIPSAEKARAILGPFAVRHNLAHKLWGWGNATQVVQLKTVPQANAEPTNWSELLEFRKKNARTEWTVKQKGIAAAEATRRKAMPGAIGVAIAMAGELGISVSLLNKHISEPDQCGKRAAARSKSA